MPATLEDESTLTGQFLTILAGDIASHPERLQAIDAALVQRIGLLVSDIDVDLDAALPPESE